MEPIVIRSERKTICAQIRQGQLIVRAPRQASQEDISRFLLQHRKWIESHLAKAQQASTERKLTAEELRTLSDKAWVVIAARVAYYAPRIGVTYGKITIRRQRTRWGSCSSRGDLSFNCLLMLAPPEVLDSVVVHELCHRKEMNHSDRFYAEVLRVCPDYRTQHRWLSENGGSLMAML